MPRVGKKMAEGAPDSVSGARIAAKNPKAIKRAPTSRKMPLPLPCNLVMTDFTKKTDWVLGLSIGKGGFGEIYTATRTGDVKEYVIKIEPHENGPLFTELSFYRRIAKPSSISEWKCSKRLSYLAIPEFVAAGDHTHLGVKYRFMVMHRYGEDIEKKFVACHRLFGMKTVCYLALRLLDALEFLHEAGYVHADIKGSNLLTGISISHQQEVFLVDYGLAYRYCPDGVHKEYIEDPRRKHDGTIEFTSIDAHKGVNPSRRSDLEILGYCLLQWACGRLPWEDRLTDKEYVAREKIRFKSDISGLLSASFHGNSSPSCLCEYMKSVFKMEYKQRPNYNQLKGLFESELRDMGCKDNHSELDWLTIPTQLKVSKGNLKSRVKRRAKDSDVAPPAKVQRSSQIVNEGTSKQVLTRGEKDSRYGIDVEGAVPEVTYPPELGYIEKSGRLKKAALGVYLDEQEVGYVSSRTRSKYK